MQILRRWSTLRTPWVLASRNYGSWVKLEQKTMESIIPWSNQISRISGLWPNLIPRPIYQDQPLAEVVEIQAPGNGEIQPMKAINTRKQLRRWKYRRKRDGGKDRKFRLKYGWVLPDGTWFFLGSILRVDWSVSPNVYTNISCTVTITVYQMLPQCGQFGADLKQCRRFEQETRCRKNQKGSEDFSRRARLHSHIV